MLSVNPNKPNGFSHPYQMVSPFSLFRAFGVIFLFISFFDEIHVSKQTSHRWDAAFCGSHPGQFCLPMPHKKSASLIWVQRMLVISIHTGEQPQSYLDHASLCSEQQKRHFDCVDKQAYYICHCLHMSLVVRKPVFGISNQVRHKPGCTTTEDG